MRKSALVIGLLLILVGCDRTEPARTAQQPPAPARSPETGSPQPDPTPKPDSSPPTTPKDLEVWFTYGESLFVTQRQVDPGPAVGRAAMEELLGRPTELEANAGVSTAVPAGTRLLGLTIADGVATVDLSEEYGSTRGGTPGEGFAVAQVVYTLTQFPTVDGVSFEIEGTPLEMTPGHGIDLSRPQTRNPWEGDLPAILVQSPSIGERVSTPVTVAGSADVFEATVQMRILDAEGHGLDRAFTTATCGTGCRGDFSHELRFDVDTEQHGLVEVWWDSPEDGSRRDVVRIPVTLVP